MSMPVYKETCYHGGMNQPEQITEDFLICRLCLLEFKHRPRLLTCGHTFCEACLNAYIGTCYGAGPRRDICCPLCARPTPLPGAPCCPNAGLLPVNLFIETQMDQILRRHNNHRAEDDPVSLHKLSGYVTPGYTERAEYGTCRYCFQSCLEHCDRK